MRVAFILRSPPKKLGTLEQWFLGVVEELRRRDHAVDLFTPQPVHPAVHEALARVGAGWGALETLEHGSRLAAVRRLAGYDLVYANMVQPRSPLALRCYAAWPAKVVLVDHGSGVPGPASALRRQLSQAMDHVTLLRVDAVVGVSEYVRQRNLARFGLHPRRAHVIYNGVDPQRFTTEKTPAGAGGLRVLCVAQLIPEKGVDVLLKAMARTRATDATLRVVGFGRMEEPWRALTRELGLEGRVEFLGLRNDVHLLTRETDVFVHPAVWDEAFGLTVTEGMASGCGVIATRTGAIPEIITDGEDGLLVPRGDAAALAQALDRLAAEPALRLRLGAAGRRTVERRFTLARCIREHADFIERITYDRRAAPVRLHPARPAALAPRPTLPDEAGRGEAQRPGS